MEAIWVSKRIELWQRLRDPVKRTDDELAHLIGMSRAWVQRWRHRFQGISGEDMTPFLSRSRRRKTSPKQVTEPVEAKILHLRDTLNEQYRRRVGARNILFHLHNDPDLQAQDIFVPRSHSTVHEVLVRFGRVPRRGPRVHVPREPAAPMQVWEIDFTDVVTAHSPETEKHKHQVEVFDVIDTGTSIALDTTVSDHFDAQHALIALIDVFRSAGLPRVVRFDRDPRFVASWTMDKFPSAFMRFLLCVGVTPDVCPPHRPDLKPYVERFIRTQKEECIYPDRPATVTDAQRLLGHHRSFYNDERPNQAVTCRNQPPSQAAGNLPRLPRLPPVVDPDAWLKHYHQQGFKRRVRSNGTVTVDTDRYYIGKQYAGQQVLLVVDAPAKQLAVWLGNQCLKRCAIRNLFHGELPLADYVDRMIQAAQSEEKRLKAQRNRRQRAA
jgi:hypothetical protein